MSRPLVSVWKFEGDSAAMSSTATLPAVFQSPIRHDIVHYVHTLMAKNNRQAYAVTARAGMGVSFLLLLHRVIGLFALLGSLPSHNIDEN
jgi:hypothetical protein